MPLRPRQRARKPRRLARQRKLGRAIADIAAVSPGVAVRLLLRSFAYPQRTPPARRSAEVLASAEPLSFLIGRTKLSAYRWAPPSRGGGPTVALFHDYERGAGYFADYVAPLLDKGCTVIALDAPASGRSGGTRLCLSDYVRAVHRLNRLTGPWHTAAGHGFGACALVQATAQMRPGERPARLVALGMSADSDRAYARRLAAAGITADLRERFWRQLGRLRDAPAPYDNALAVGRLADVSGLIIHDLTDPHCTAEEADEIAAAWPGARVERLEGFGHDLLGTAVLRRVVPFIGAKTSLRETALAA